jgi:hypothetical protein
MPRSKRPANCPPNTQRSERRGLLADLERALNGLGHAHLGDYLPREDKLAALGVPQPVQMSVSLPGPDEAAGSRRRVALAVQGRVEPKALRYARAACERMDADLDLVTDLPEDGLAAVMQTQSQGLAQGGHRLEVVRLGRDILSGIIDYARARRGLLFVVVSAEDGVAERVMARAREAGNLDVPWVVVAAAETG